MYCDAQVIYTTGDSCDTLILYSVSSGRAAVRDSTFTTVNFISVEKLRTLRIAWLYRKVTVEDYR